jgi:UDP:flavonoid glycosyltransferase YjiC (YdhE family)
MAKFLFTTLPTDDLGLLTRSLPIARELAARGHLVLFSSPARAPSRLIAEAGFDNLTPRHPLYDLMAMDRSLRGLAGFVAARRWRGRYGSLFNFLAKVIPAIPLKAAPATPETWTMDHAAAQMGMLSEGFVRANCAALKDLIEECEADVVVDFWNPFAVMAARAGRKPVVTVIQGDAHPASRGFIWWKTPPANIPTVVPVVNKVLADYRLRPLDQFAELCVGDLTLVVGTPETDPLPQDAGVVYVGPILWQKPGASLPDWVDRLDRDKPLIWVYSGNPSYGTFNQAFDSAVVVRACVAALAGEAMQVVLTTGYHPLPKDVVPLPANFRHEPYLPGLAMAERSDLLIHHGGLGSCQTGLVTGTPAVIIPTYAERESNARRVAALGAGAFISVETLAGKKHVPVEDLRATVRRVLADPSFAANARRMSQKLRAYGGAAQAAELIDGFSRRVD